MHNPYGHGYPPTGHPPGYPHGHSPWGAGYPPPPVPPAAPAGRGHLTNPRFLKGALVGALATYLLTNETVQHNAIKAAVRAWSMVQGGVEEMKERFRDAEAELHTAQAPDDED